MDACYFDSLADLSDFKVTGRMVRTKGIEQEAVWYSADAPKPGGIWEEDRRYTTGTFQGKDFFAKQIVSLPKDLGSIADFIRIHVENLCLLSSLPFVPGLLFWTDDTVGMTFETGQTVKELWRKGIWTRPFLDSVFPSIVSLLNIAQVTLGKVGRGVDISWNNLLFDLDNQRIILVDLDPTTRYVPIMDIMLILSELASGRVGFDKNGRLVEVMRRK